MFQIFEFSFDPYFCLLFFRHFLMIKKVLSSTVIFDPKCLTPRLRTAPPHLTSRLHLVRLICLELPIWRQRLQSLHSWVFKFCIGCTILIGFYPVQWELSCSSTPTCVKATSLFSSICSEGRIRCRKLLSAMGHSTTFPLAQPVKVCRFII
jgi:hypothetical protein